MVERIAPLLFYLIKTMITTTTIATTKPSMPPTMGSTLLVWGSGGEHCTTTILRDKENKDDYHQYLQLWDQCYLSEAMVEKFVLLLSYLIKTRMTTTTIATTTPPIPPAMGSMLLVWGSGGEDCTTTILPDKDNKDDYHHYCHYYAINTSCYGINVTCLRLWWRGLYYYCLTW